MRAGVGVVATDPVGFGQPSGDLLHALAQARLLTVGEFGALEAMHPGQHGFAAAPHPLPVGGLGGGGVDEVGAPGGLGALAWVERDPVDQLLLVDPGQDLLQVMAFALVVFWRDGLVEGARVQVLVQGLELAELALGVGGDAGGQGDLVAVLAGHGGELHHPLGVVGGHHELDVSAALE